MFNIGDIVFYKPELPHTVYEGKVSEKAGNRDYYVRWYKKVGDPTYMGLELRMAERHLLLKEPFDVTKEAEWE